MINMKLYLQPEKNDKCNSHIVYPSGLFQVRTCREECILLITAITPSGIVTVFELKQCPPQQFPANDCAWSGY